MVDATDLKSVFRKEVRVRVPPPAPVFALWATPGAARGSQSGFLRPVLQFFPRTLKSILTTTRSNPEIE